MPPVPPVPRQYSHGHLYLLLHPWGQEVLLVLGSLCHPGAEKMAPAAPPNHPPPRHSSWGQPGLRTSMGMPSCWYPAVLSPSPTHGCAPGGASMGFGGTAGAGLPSLLQHRPRWEPGGEAEGTMLGTAHHPVSQGWGRQRWTCWAASLTGLPGGPGSPCGETGVIAGPFPSSPLPPPWDPALPSPSPPGGQLVPELPVEREQTSGGWRCLGTCTRGMAAPAPRVPGPRHRGHCPSSPLCPMAQCALGLLPHPGGGEEEEGVKGIFPPCARAAAPGQGRAGIAPVWPQLLQPTYLFALGARHATVPLQSEAEEGFSEPSSLHTTLPLPHALPQSPSGPGLKSHQRPLGSNSNPQAQPPRGCRDTRTR